MGARADRGGGPRTRHPPVGRVGMRGRPQGGRKWRQIGSRKVRVAARLDESKAAWIVRQKARGEVANAQIAESMGVKVRWVQVLWARYRHLRPPTPVSAAHGQAVGRPAGAPRAGAVAGLHSRRRAGAARMEGDAGRSTGIHIPHRTIQEVMKADGEVTETKKGVRRRAWVRWECSHSNMMWHTDFKQLADGRWFIAYEDDAARYLTAHGVFKEAATANALAVLHAGIAKHGRPASIMTDHGSQFFANEAEGRKRGQAAFEAELERLGIRHVVARVRHPQTNGKIERVHKDIEDHLPSFEAESSLAATRCDRPGATP